MSTRKGKEQAIESSRRKGKQTVGKGKEKLEETEYDFNKEFFDMIGASEDSQWKDLFKKSQEKIVLDFDNKPEITTFLNKLRERATRIVDKMANDIRILHKTLCFMCIPNVFVKEGGVLVKLYITAWRLYFVAFQIDGSDMVYEAIEVPSDKKKQRKACLKTSTLFPDLLSLNRLSDLGFGFNYGELSDVHLDLVKFGFYKLKTAVREFQQWHTTKEHSAASVKEMKLAFLTICVMICEALRSSVIEKQVVKIFNRKEQKVIELLSEVAHSWFSRSKAYSQFRAAMMNTNNSLCAEAIKELPTVFSDVTITAPPQKFYSIEELEKDLRETFVRHNL